MDKKEKEQKFWDYLSGEANFDMDSFEQDVNDDSVLRHTLQGLDQLGNRLPAPDKEKMWNVVHGAIREKRRVWIWRAAAAVLLPVCIFLSYWGWYHEAQREELAVMETPAAKQVQLFLTGGDVVDLTGIRRDTLIRESGTGIQIAQGKGLTYLKEASTEVAPVYNVLRVPRGNEYYLELSDGTEVWMNSDSELRFSVNFMGNERKVFLKGEAYFKVTRDSLRPFRVMADEMMVEVLGTSFNVNAYRDEGKLIATLVEGVVRVKDTISGFERLLQPNQQAELQDGNGVVREVQVDEVVAWKEGRFLFREMSLENIAKQLERWFDIEFIFLDDTLRKHEFTGIVKRYDRVEDICALIEETTYVKFEIHGNKVMVTSRK